MRDKYHNYLGIKDLSLIFLIFFVVNAFSGVIYWATDFDIAIENYSKICYVPCFIIIILLTAFYREKRLKKSLSLKIKRGLFDARYALIGIIMLIFINIFLEPIMAVLPDDKQSYIDFFGGGNRSFTIILSVVFAPILEEVFFRRMVLRDLCNHFVAWKAILLSALFFASVHLNFVQGIPAFFAGVLLGYIYVKTNFSLTTTIFIHFFNNLVSMEIVTNGLMSESMSFSSMITDTTIYWGVYI
ncbi:MAG: CPBP family intramembrane metalloprotease, partial [Bacteroidetes bacterium]|nr:CPBP family intramembrane metalloprotease [Bacteroidota bacterium]